MRVRAAVSPLPVASCQFPLPCSLSPVPVALAALRAAFGGADEFFHTMSLATVCSFEIWKSSSDVDEPNCTVLAANLMPVNFPIVSHIRLPVILALRATSVLKLWVKTPCTKILNFNYPNITRNQQLAYRFSLCMINSQLTRLDSQPFLPGTSRDAAPTTLKKQLPHQNAFVFLHFFGENAHESVETIPHALQCKWKDK